MDTYSVRRGASLPLDVQLADDQGEPITGYLGTEALACHLWPGGSLPAAATPTAIWASASQGRIAILVSAAQTLALAEGRYRGTLDLTDPLYGPLEAYSFALDVLTAPGLGTIGLLYASFADMLVHGRAWLRQLQSPDDDAGFAVQLDIASRWLDDLILARYPTNNTVLLGDPGYGATVYGVNPGQLPNQWLKAQLLAGALVIRPKVVECVAKKALSVVCKGQVGVGDAKVDYRLLGRIYDTESSAIALTLVAEICTDGTGNPSFGIPLTGTNMRPIFGN